MPAHVIIISPHFDDGVFSCGGTAHQLRRAGRPVTIMTLMGGLFEGPLPDSPILADLHRRWQAGQNPLRYRQLEDERAVASLGVEYAHIPLPDCVYRLADGAALYPSEESLFGQVQSVDYAPAVLERVALPVNDEASGAIIYLPLAVGQHVDHQIALAWGLRRLAEKRAGWSFRFYAEYPYSKADKATDEALSALDLEPVSVRLSEADMRAKIEAIACYQSQISTFWPSAAAMAADVRRAFSDGAGAYVERFWQVLV